jgi:hypothetical protein
MLLNEAEMPLNNSEMLLNEAEMTLSQSLIPLNEAEMTLSQCLMLSHDCLTLLLYLLMPLFPINECGATFGKVRKSYNVDFPTF